ncbi:peptidase M42 [Mycolicibacterium elephantis]|uniref:osmoprotectant NAGGN system M42 family peptidase n=1 Tax=Mycolicibacterium elephantis TaxID=81858 RepID=UPI0006291849|nr:osmoprotectant NAGGN system M42 family peptidase [Mycolicibacterium elephantis]KKW62900.1 peptidase M42 [Mycolicibacterium elephantis]
MRQTAAMSEADRAWMIDTLIALLETPSPTGRTDAVMQLIGEIFDDLGLPFTLTRRGALIAELAGESSTADRALVVHADTIGCMVRGFKDNGRLEVIPVGSFSARFAAGARVQIFCEDVGQVITGTILPLKASGHAFGDEVDTQPTDWEHVEVRVDRKVSSREDLERLGIKVGDYVALIASPELTDDGFVVSRHLDDQAGVAIALALTKHIAENDVVLPHRTAIMVTISEEVGYGASSGLPADIAELVTIDNAVCAPGQYSIEDGVTVPMSDLHGPYDYHLTRNLCRLAEEREIPFARDIFRFYRSDAAAAIEAGASTRAALVGPGVDGSHGWERTHVESLEATYRLLQAWLQTPLTFAHWDAKPSGTGNLRDFPSSKQPVPRGRRASVSRDGAT